MTRLIDCNHQLEIRCINITQITPRVLQLASLTEGRHGCDYMMTFNAPLMSINVNNTQDSCLTRPISPKRVCMVVNVSNTLP